MTKMAETENGGSAFPQNLAVSPSGDVYQSGELYPGSDGMTLRDYFAAKAMAARIETLGEHSHSSDAERMSCKAETAQRAYEMADAMLAERSKATGADQ